MDGRGAGKEPIQFSYSRQIHEKKERELHSMVEWTNVHSNEKQVK